MIYDKIIELLKENLPDNFMLSFVSNIDTNWAEILKEEALVHGVLRIDSGETEYVANQTVQKENLRVTFAIPNDKQVFDEAMDAIGNLVTLNNTFIPTDDGRQCRLTIDGRSTASINTINRIEWIVTDLALQIQTYDNLVGSEEAEIKINNNLLDVSIIDIVYDYALNCETKILGNTNVPKNYPAGTQKQLIINVIPQATAPIYLSLLQSEDTMTLFDISYKNGLLTRTFKARLIGVNEHVASGSTYVSQIKFLRTNE